MERGERSYVSWVRQWSYRKHSERVRGRDIGLCDLRALSNLIDEESVNSDVHCQMNKGTGFMAERSASLPSPPHWVHQVWA